VTWHGGMLLTLPELEIGFFDATLPNESWHAGRGDGP
jgi:hypothetical protein